MLPMHDLDEYTKPKWNPLRKSTIKLLGFDHNTFVDLVGMVYGVFPQRKDEVLLEEQRPREEVGEVSARATSSPSVVCSRSL